MTRTSMRVGFRKVYLVRAGQTMAGGNFQLFVDDIAN